MKGKEFQYKSGQMVATNSQSYSFKQYMSQMLNTSGLTKSNELTSSLVNYGTLSFCKSIISYSTSLKAYMSIKAWI